MIPFINNAMTGLSAVFKDAKKSQNHLHQELPYRHYDYTENLFDNRTSRGFGLQISVLGGANDQLIISLNNLVTTLPQGKKWDYQLQLIGHNRVGHYIDANEKVLAQRGGILAEMAKRDAQYARYAAKQGFFHHQKNNHFDLRDYEAYFFVSTTGKNPDALRDVRSEVETALVQLGFDTLTVYPEMLLSHVGDILNFDPGQDRPLTRNYNPLDPLNLQALSPDTECLMRRDHLALRHTSPKGEEVKTRVVSMGLSKLPHDFRLYGLPECFASIRNVSRTIVCPHMLTLNFRCEPTGKQEADNNNKITDLTKTVESKMVLLAPTAKEELKERKDIQAGLNGKEFIVTSMAFTLTLFTQDTRQRQDVQAAKNAFEGAGLNLITLNMLQSQSLLSVLPFMMSDGFWNDAKKAGRVRTLKSSNLVNFSPWCWTSSV